MKMLLTYYPIFFVLFFALFLIAISAKDFIGIHKQNKYIRDIWNLDKYMGIKTGNVSEMDIVNVLKDYDFQYKGTSDRR